MANLPEVVNYDAGVYQLEVTDLVQGGASGKDNVPLKNLANRTAWLKAQVDALNAAGNIKGKLLRTQYFNSSGTWTKGADVAFVEVEVIGGGANADAYVNGGDGGRAIKKILAASLGATVTVTVGAGGGGNSSFGGHCTANGGSGQAGGSASGGDINLTGMHGFGHDDNGYTGASPAGSGRGGQSYYGGGSNGGSGLVIVREFG